MKKTLIILFLAAMCIPSGRCFAQALSIETSPFWTTGPANNSYSIAAGDIDMDGDLDLVFANWGEPNTIYLSADGETSVIPSWSSTLSLNSTSVALGDINGDGYLDIIFGNYLQPVTVYINNSGTIPVDTTWALTTGSPTYQVELADIDDDGALDLLTANFGGRSTCHLNQGGRFLQAPWWLSASHYNTTSIAAGDIDDDGDLDITCGNFEQSNTLFINDIDSVNSLPVWSSDSLMMTWDIALGDVDGDGLIDLLCGNKGEFTLAQKNFLYLNTGGTFSATPVWMSNQTLNTAGAELADLDGDGDLDATFGNTDQFNTIYRNDNGVLTDDPVWFSDQQNRTYILLPADMDGDGDPDLVFANSGDIPDGEPNTIYRNIRGALTQIPRWISDQPAAVRAIAACDIDNDGDPDIVCGTNGEPNRIFMNNNGTIEPVPGWSSADSRTTFSVATGDIDGNGYDDLVCGNLDEPNTLYLNFGGTLEESNSWSSDGSNTTWGVNLGDFNNDGDLDLACGNLSQSNNIYINVSGSIETSPSWSSEPSNATWCILAGDIDGDGLTDLIAGNGGFMGQNNCIYKNTGAGLESAPSWSSASTAKTWALAIGDVDGDGDMDLACGNSDQYNTIFVNDGEGFPANPGWSSVPSEATRSLVFSDIDGDGMLDLASGNSGQPARIYGGSSTLPSTTPLWTSDVDLPSNCVICVDIDMDGDVDLLSGNYNERLSIFEGLAHPVYKGDPLDLSDQLPSTHAFLSRVSMEKTDENIYDIDMTIVDPDSDPAFILTKYRYTGEQELRPLESTATGPEGPFSTSPAGDQHTIQWDILQLPFDRRQVELVFTVIENPRRVASVRHLPVYRKEIGPVMPVRPMISLNPQTLDFPVVTAGDTVSAELMVLNSGNAALEISDVGLPDNGMRLETEPPFSLDPGQSLGIIILLEPLSGDEPSGGITLSSNDPWTPLSIVDFTSDVRALAVSSRLLKPVWQDEVEPGEALTVIVTPAPLVEVEHGTLYFRETGSATWQQLTLSPSLDDFIAIIPGEYITEAGLDYYIEVENTPVISTDPPGAPVDSIFSVYVRPPEWVETRPLVNSGEGFMTGRQIQVLLTFDAGTLIQTGTLYFRKGGDIDFLSSPVDIGSDPPSALVPDTMVTPAGVEYWLEINTLTSRLTDPVTGPENDPDQIIVTVPDLRETSSWPGGHYRMASIPLVFGEEFSGTVEALLSDQQAFGPYDPVKWRSFIYSSESMRYIELVEDETGLFNPVAGKGFWLVCRSDASIKTAPVTGYSVPTDDCQDILLSPGWNQVGNPFTFDVPWDSVLVDSFSMVEAEGVLVDPPVGFDGVTYTTDHSVIEPFNAYWIRNNSDSEVTLHIPPCREKSLLDQRTEKGPVASACLPEWDWRCSLRVSCTNSVDEMNVFGMNSEALQGADRLDRYEPPLAPGRSISLYFVDSVDDAAVRLLSTDARNDDGEKNDGATGDNSGMWFFDVAKNYSSSTAGDPVEIKLAWLEGAAPDLRLILVDRILGEIVDLRDTGEYNFLLGVKDQTSSIDDARFVILVGNEELADSTGLLPVPPTKTSLIGNYPNPFNPSTRIRFDLVEKARVRLDIFDVRGRLVATPLDRTMTAGRKEIDWTAADRNGEPLASGVYFCRLTAGRVVETRKMVLLR